MIIKCKKIINGITKEELDWSPFLTLEKKYIVLYLQVSLLYGIRAAIVSDDHNCPIFPSLDGFEVISQKIPKNWVIKMENNFFSMMPKSWMYPTFFEEAEDGNPSAVALLRKEVALMYQEEGWPLDGSA